MNTPGAVGDSAGLRASERSQCGASTVPAVLRHRLTFGPIMIVVTIVVLWLDEIVDGIPTPSWLRPDEIAEGAATSHWLLARGIPFHETLPRGTVLFVVLAAIGIAAASELARILRKNGVSASTRITCGASLTGLMVSSLVPANAQGVTSTAIVSSCAAVVLLASLVFYSRGKSVEGVVAATGGALLSFVYLGLLLGFMLVIRREHSPWVLLWILFVTKSCDIGAYFTGRSIGRHKLIPWLSPGKTWEGLAGGVLTSAALGALGLWILTTKVLKGPDAFTASIAAGAFAGFLFGIVGQAGDLIASLFKRDAGLKDAGNSLPGFGGVLDVVDSPILVAPVAYWWLVIVS